MHRLWALLGILVLASCKKEEPQDITVAKQKIWESVKKYYQSSDKCDIDAMEGLLTADCSLRRTDDIVHGKEKCVEAFKAVVAENKQRKIDGKRTTLVGNEEINVTRDVAIVTLVANANDPTGTLRGLVTLVFRRQDGQWLIAHLHETWEKK